MIVIILTRVIKYYDIHVIEHIIYKNEDIHFTLCVYLHQRISGELENIGISKEEWIIESERIIKY